MASLGSSIRSAARATSSAYRSVPIRWRLAGGSAALTFVILAGFAAIVGVLTEPAGPRPVRRRGQRGLGPARQQPSCTLRVDQRPARLRAHELHLSDYASAEAAQIRIFDDDGDRAVQSEPGRRSTAPSRSTAPRSSRPRPGPGPTGGRLPGRRAQAIGVQPIGEVLAAVRPAALRRRPHARPGAVLPAARRARRHDPRPDRRTGDRPAGDAPDRRS